MSRKVLVLLMVTALLLGALVILLNPSYRISRIQETNSGYYPDTSVGEPTMPPAPGGHQTDTDF